MKKGLFVIIVLLGLSFCGAAQKQDSLFIEPEEDMFSFNTSAIFGQNIFAQNYFVQSYGFDYKKKVNNKWSVFGGMNLFSYNATRGDVVVRDLSPRRLDADVSAYMGATYKVNEHLDLSGSMFYSSLGSTIGGDVDLLYKFSEGSSLNIHATFVKSLQPTCYHYPISYWDYEVFQPFILGY